MKHSKWFIMNWPLTACCTRILHVKSVCIAKIRYSKFSSTLKAPRDLRLVFATHAKISLIERGHRNNSNNTKEGGTAAGRIAASVILKSAVIT